MADASYSPCMTKRHWAERLAWCGLCIVLFGFACDVHGQSKGETDWPAYGNDPGGMRYSSLRQIDPSNVTKLRVAWTFRTGDISNGSNGWKRSGLETTPILVEG